MDAVDRLMRELGFLLKHSEPLWNHVRVDLLCMAGRAVSDDKEFDAQQAKDYKDLHDNFEKALRRTFPGYDLACLAQYGREEPQEEDQGVNRGEVEACQTS